MPDVIGGASPGRVAAPTHIPLRRLQCHGPGGWQVGLPGHGTSKRQWFASLELRENNQSAIASRMSRPPIQSPAKRRSTYTCSCCTHDATKPPFDAGGGSAAFPPPQLGAGGRVPPERGSPRGLSAIEMLSWPANWALQPWK